MYKDEYSRSEMLVQGVKRGIREIKHVGCRKKKGELRNPEKNTLN
jgi:hypothetical protein